MMPLKLSTRTRYGVRALVDIALHDTEGPVHLKGIAAREEISEKYLEHLMPLLKGAGLVRSVRGAQGGYLLTKSAAEVNLYDVVNTLEGSLAPVECVTNAEVCHRSGSCVTRDVWGEIQEVINNVLASTTLEDLCRREREKRKPDTDMYYI